MKENLLKKKKKGFTLIELIVVIAIIAIIALIAIPKVMGYQDDAKKKADIANAKTIANITATEITNGHISTPTTSSYSFEVKSGNTQITVPATDGNGAAYYVEKALQTIPTLQYKDSNGKHLWVEIDTNGSVTVSDTTSTTTNNVTTTSKGTNQIFPIPTSGTSIYK